MSFLIKSLGLLAGASAGAVIGFYGAVIPATYVACYWIWPGTSLCGLPPLLAVAPFATSGGATFGATYGLRLARRYLIA